MKQNRLINFCAALALGLISSTTAFAQEVAFSIDKQFVAPGDTATVALNVKTTTLITAFSGRINLPEGLTFASTDSDNDYVVETTDMSKTADVMLTGKTNKSATFYVGSMNSTFEKTDKKVELLKFKVVASKEIPVMNTISYTDFKGAYKYTSYTQDDFTSVVYNADYEATPTIEGFSIDAGNTATVAVALNFSKDKIVGVDFDYILPEGLTIVEDSYKVTERDAYHTVKPLIPTDEVDGGFSVLAPLNEKHQSFTGTKGAFLTFDVKAAEDFKSSQLQIVNFAAYSLENDYYGKDVTVNVTKNTTVGINGVDAANSGEAADGIYQLNGVRTDKMQRGVNIVIKDGKAIKVVKK